MLLRCSDGQGEWKKTFCTSCAHPELSTDLSLENAYIASYVLFVI